MTSISVPGLREASLRNCILRSGLHLFPLQSVNRGQCVPPYLLIQAAPVLPDINDDSLAIDLLNKMVRVKVPGVHTEREQELASADIAAQSKLQEQVHKKLESPFNSGCPSTDEINPQTVSTEEEKKSSQRKCSKSTHTETEQNTN